MTTQAQPATSVETPGIESVGGERASSLRTLTASGAPTRRSERARGQAARQAEARRVRDEKAEAEAAATRARSAAARKGAETRRRAALVSEGGKVAKGGARTRSRRFVVSLKYAHMLHTPEFQHVDLHSSREVFWLKAGVREYFFRFDKLCRLPTRYSVTLNDVLAAWPHDLFRACSLSLLKLLVLEFKPVQLVKTCIADIDAGGEEGDFEEAVRAFLVSVNGSAPLPTPDSERGSLQLVRELLLLALLTETVRVTISADVEQLKVIEKESQEEIRKIQTRLKEQSQKLLKLKKVDKTVYKDRVDNAQRAAQQKTFKAQQTLYLKLHKFNMRTAPIAEDRAGNRFWSLQYKSQNLSAWGAWILCELKSDPVTRKRWEEHFSSEIDRVVAGRDKLLLEKKEARRAKIRTESVKSEAPDSLGHQTAPGDADAGTSQATETPAPSAAVSHRAHEPTADSADLKPETTRRRFPKMKIAPLPAPVHGVHYFTVQGRQEIEALAEWVSQQPGVDAKMTQDILDVGKYLADDE